MGGIKKEINNEKKYKNNKMINGEFIKIELVEID